jgi:hypothetical protein
MQYIFHMLTNIEAFASVNMDSVLDKSRLNGKTSRRHMGQFGCSFVHVLMQLLQNVCLQTSVLFMFSASNTFKQIGQVSSAFLIRYSISVSIVLISSLFISELNVFTVSCL